MNRLRFCIGSIRGGESHTVAWLLVHSIVHGTHETVNRICDHPDIQAISFVGSNAAGQYIYERGSRSGKRIQVLLSLLLLIGRLSSHVPVHSAAQMAMLYVAFGMPLRAPH